jgi:hypothetical protein
MIVIVSSLWFVALWVRSVLADCFYNAVRARLLAFARDSDTVKHNVLDHRVTETLAVKVPPGLKREVPQSDAPHLRCC